MKLKYFLFFLVTITTLSVNSQKKTTPKVTDGYEITFNTENLKGKKIELCLYYGLYGEKSIADSITISSDVQKVVFNKKQKVFGAIYLLRIAKENGGIDLVIDNGDKMTIQLNKPDVTAIEVSNNSKNSDFLVYQRNVATKSAEENVGIRNSLISKYPTSVLALYFKIQNKISTKLSSNPEEIKNFQDTFFKNFKPTEPSMFLMPNVYQMLYKYVSSHTINNENYQKCIKTVMADLKCNSNNYKIYVKWFLSNFLYYESYNLEETFISFIKNYVDIKDCNNFTDGELAGYRNKSETMKTIPLNTKVPNLIVKDVYGKEFNLYDNISKFDYTYIAFYSPTCSHCNETMPKVQEYFEALQKQNAFLKLQLIAVLNDDDASLWDKFITDKKIQNWINVKTKGETRDFQKDFNAYANPNFILTNKEGIILLKSYNQKALNEVFTRQNK